MRKVIILAFIASMAPAVQADTRIYPTIKGTSLRDYTAPGYVVEGNHAYPTIPGTGLRDYTERGYVREGNVIYSTIPGTGLRDYSEPGYRIEQDEE